MADDDNRPLNRRNFFRQGFREFLKPLSQIAGPLEEAMRQIGAMDDAPPAPANAATPPRSPGKPLLKVLRPPGALAEQRFRETCSRCGDCVKVCPAQCITIDKSGINGAGAPFIDPDVMPCVLCDGLLCMHACPTGALTPVPLGEIDMGTAAWDSSTCVRTHGQACTICVDECPVGEVAIRLNGMRVEVLADGCTGCGVCQNRCPTRPRSIIVQPRPMTGAGPVGRR